MKKFILIDGNAILHRAYHALPPLTDKKGTVVNAVYGFCSMLLKVIADLAPDYIAVAFDRAAPTFRKQLYVGYQAKRPEMSEDLSGQIIILHEVIEKMGIPMFEIDGYEADDIIGTIATRIVQGKWEVRNAKLDKEVRSGKKSHLSHHLPVSHVSSLTSNVEVIIVTGDRDMLQLVKPHVKVFAPIIGLTKTILFDEALVEEKYGLKPTQIVDYKALVGDASDNYPGVTGIGPKTAATLLKEYENLENLYANIGKLSPRIGEMLANDAEQSALAKKLATIACDAPVSFDIESCSFRHFDSISAKQAFEDLGFKSLQKRLPDPQLGLL